MTETVTNTLAYYDTDLLKVVKGFIVKSLGSLGSIVTHSMFLVGRFWTIKPLHLVVTYSL